MVQALLYGNCINANVQNNINEIGEAKTKGFEYNATIGTLTTAQAVIYQQV